MNEMKGSESRYLSILMTFSKKTTIFLFVWLCVSFIFFYGFLFPKKLFFHCAGHTSTEKIKNGVTDEEFTKGKQEIILYEYLFGAKYSVSTLYSDPPNIFACERSKNDVICDDGIDRIEFNLVSSKLSFKLKIRDYRQLLEDKEKIERLEFHNGFENGLELDCNRKSLATD